MNWKEYKSQGVQSVDMCASVIFQHRKRFLPIKAIHLYPRMYEQFKSFTQKNLGRDLEDGEQITFDSVEIVKGYSSQKTPLVIEMFQENFNIDEAVKNMVGKA